MAVISKALIERIERLERQHPPRTSERLVARCPDSPERVRIVLAMLVEAGAFRPPGPPVDSPLHAVHLRLVEAGVWLAYGGDAADDDDDRPAPVVVPA